MDRTRISSMLENIYIPNSNKQNATAIPQHHPSLIMQDYQTDTTHHQKCGCCGQGVCITELAWWNKKGQQKKAVVVTAAEKPVRPRMTTAYSSSSISSTGSY